MEKKEDLIKNFKIAIASTAKSVSNVNDLEVIFGNENFQTDKIIIKLPEMESTNNKINYIKARALADSEALKIRYSNKKILESQEPRGNISKKLYSIAEKIRYEKLGSLEFKGIRKNIKASYIEKLKNLDTQKKSDKLVEAFENYLRINFFNIKNNKNVEKTFNNFKKDFDIKLKNKLKILNDSIQDQLKFNSIISDLISDPQDRISRDQSVTPPPFFAP